MDTLRRTGLCAAAMLMIAGGAVAQQLREFSVAFGSVGFGNAAVPLADQLGLFEKHGIKLKTVVMDSGSAATTAMLSGSVDTALSGGAELASALGRGQKVALLVNLYQGSAGTLVLAKSAVDKLGVSVNAPAAARLKALDGLLIATPSATSGYTASLRGAAARAGVNLRLTYMAPQAMASAFEAGAIQGYIAGAPTWAPPVLKGTGVVWLSGPKHDFPPENTPASNGNLQALATYAKANPDMVRRLNEIFADLSNVIEEKPAEAKAALGRAYPSLDPKTLDLLFASESSAWRYSRYTAADLQHDIDFVKSSGVALPQIDSVNPADVLP